MKQRLDELTLFRAIACLSVLLVHISAVPFENPNIGEVTLEFFGFLNRAFKFTTPAFIFLSGLMQYYHQWQGKFDYKKFMKKRFGPIFWPYLVAASGYFVLLSLFGYYPFTPLEYVKRLFLGSANYHLYFVVIIMQFYVFMPIILKVFEKWNAHAVLLGSLAINLLSREYFIFPYSDRFFVNYLFFFMLGAYVVRYMEAFKAISVKKLIGSAVVYLSLSGFYGYQFVTTTLSGAKWNYHLTSLTWFAFSTAAIGLIYSLSVWLMPKSSILRNGAQTISSASYWIYLLHPLVLYVSSKTWEILGFASTTLGFAWNIFWVFGSMIIFAMIYPILLGYWKRFIQLKNTLTVRS